MSSAERPDPDAHDVTMLLRRWSDGDEEALPALMDLLHAELRRLARKHFRREQAAHTLEPTALVNELYLRLVDQRAPDIKNRQHFFALASRIMRRLLIDYARRRRVRRRDVHVSLGSVAEHGAPADPSLEVSALDDALHRLATAYPREYRVVELRFLGGLSIEETASLLGVGSGTVKRDWRFARTWLLHAVESGAAPSP